MDPFQQQRRADGTGTRYRRPTHSIGERRSKKEVHRVITSPRLPRGPLEAAATRTCELTMFGRGEAHTYKRHHLKRNANKRE